MLTINDNLAALDAENNLDSTNNQLNTVVNDLSTGLSINTAADNPAGYSIAQSLESEINGYSAASSNAQDAVSVLQTAQGAMNQQESILQQANTIATQAANTTVSGDTTAAAADQQEFSSLINQLDQIAQSTTYAGVSLLNGSNAALTFQVGPQDTSDDSVVVSLATTTASGLSVSVGSGGLDLTTVSGAQAAMSAVQAAINTLASAAASIGSSQNQIQALANNVTVAEQNLTSAHANLVDVDVASETSQFTSLQVLEQSGVSVLSQAQSLPQLALKLI